MSSFFTVNIPLGTDLISSSQPLIEGNFNALYAWSSVDHTVLNGTVLPSQPQGTHQAIRFEQQAGDPVTSSSQLGFYNKLDVNNINQLWLRLISSGAVLQVTGPVSILGALGPPTTYGGQTMILGGIIVKWGNAVVASAKTITFPVAFPNNCFGVVISINNTGAATQTIVTDGYPSNTAFLARLNPSGTPLNCFWIALGN
jgi:hypothetical protein